MKTDLLFDIVPVLRQHVGRENIISAAEIADQIGLPQKDGSRVVREILADALHDGTLETYELPLCAIPGQGYFLASDYEEAQAYVNLLVTLLAEAARKLRAVLKLFGGLGLRLVVETGIRRLAARISKGGRK